MKAECSRRNIPVVNDPNSGDPTSTAYTYTYDTMGRASTMTNGLNSSV